MTDTEIENREMPEPGLPVTQSMTDEAGPYAQIDPEAQAEVQKALNLRIARDAKVPVKLPPIPPGLSPSQIVAWASAGGTVGGAAAAVLPEEETTEEETTPVEHQE